MAEWMEKVTSKGQEPNTHFRIKLGAHELYILCNHVYYPDEWVMGLDDKQYSMSIPKPTDPKEVKTAALQRAIKILEKRVNLANAAIFAAMETLR